MEEKTAYPPPYSAHDQQQPSVVVVPGAVQTTVVSTVVVGQQVGPKPSRISCRSCGAEIVTRVEYKSATKTHLIALVLCLVGCWCCVCIPYCTDSCRNADHYCPNCNAYIGAHSA